MNIRPLFLSLFTGFLLFGCQTKQTNEPAADSATATTRQAEAPEAKAAAQEEDAVAPAPLLADRKIVRNATLRFRVEKMAESEGRITKMAAQYGGMIANSEENRTGGLSEVSMTVRVPAARLDAFLGTLMKESIYTDIKTITAEDVTRQYADTEARIRAKKATETRYLQLLQKARNVQEVMDGNIDIFIQAKLRGQKAAKGDRGGID